MSKYDREVFGAASRALLASAVVFVCTGTLQAQEAERLERLEKKLEQQQEVLDEIAAEIEAEKAKSAGDTGEGEGDEKKLPGPLVLSSRENLSVVLKGRVHRMLMGFDDSRETDVLFTDSEQGPTMIRLDVTGKPNDSFSIGTNLEIGLRQNRPFLVSQDERDGGTSVTVRHAEVFFDQTSVGKFSLGRGFAAGWLAPEIDLSGTQFANLLPVGMLAPSLKFVDRSTGELSNVFVRDHFADIERLLLVDRVRYDSPRFGGAQVSASAAGDGRWDVALRTRHATGGLTLVGGASYQDEPFGGIESRVDAAVSMRHEDSGLNLTLGGASEDLERGGSAETWLVKAGWLADLFELGNTALSLDYYEVSGLRFDGDQGTSYGFFVVQKWPAFGLDFYGGLRRYEVDRPDLDLEPLLVVPFGVVLNF